MQFQEKTRKTVPELIGTVFPDLLENKLEILS